MYCAVQTTNNPVTTTTTGKLTVEQSFCPETRVLAQHLQRRRMALVLHRVETLHRMQKSVFMTNCLL